MTQEELERLRDKFVKDPDWKLMESFIFETLDFKTELDDIEIGDRDGQVVLADIMANQQLKKKYEALQSAFASIKRDPVKKPVFK